MDVYILTSTYLQYNTGNIGSFVDVFESMSQCMEIARWWFDGAVDDGAKVWVDDAGRYTTYFEGIKTKWVYECTMDEL